MACYELLQLFALLIVGHALADYPLQGEFLARAKNRFAPVSGVPWYQALGAHALIHGGVVGVITGSLLLGVLEFAAHALIDDLKCARRIGFNLDQALHVGCKLLWVAVIALTAAPSV
ncbi:DUF3307 domain-containing protein [Stenotrophomonas sp. YIM B06876]|uniref:DUF3307 domain-containing protein n=1 Tax=Stenotrophomonas sp. YIM B06876 TaxID=3060211 RepID=UPI0027389621|nr:DUF3307 domain-containing protein [Stenotrophomonas sp. YIM B06876]